MNGKTVCSPSQEVDQSLDRKSQPDTGKPVHSEPDITATIVQEEGEHTPRHQQEDADPATKETGASLLNEPDLFYLPDDLQPGILSGPRLAQLQGYFIICMTLAVQRTG